MSQKWVDRYVYRTVHACTSFAERLDRAREDTVMGGGKTEFMVRARKFAAKRQGIPPEILAMSGVEKVHKMTDDKKWRKAADEVIENAKKT